MIATPISTFARDVRRGLAKTPQRELSPQYFYDEVGAALFEAITRLPEYGLTRADERLLRVHADEIVARFPSPVVIAELGSGNGKKTRWLIEAVAGRHPVDYYPIDVSRPALEECARAGPAGSRHPARSALRCRRRGGRATAGGGRAPSGAVPRQHYRELRPPGLP